jgi:hypothetical protein
MGVTCNSHALEFAHAQEKDGLDFSNPPLGITDF